jgi:hypothetical protein
MCLRPEADIGGETDDRGALLLQKIAQRCQPVSVAV